MTFIERSVIGIPSVKTCHVLSSGEQFLEADRFIDLFHFSVLLRDGLDRYANLVHPKLGPCLWKLDALRITDQQYLTAMAEGPSNRIDMPESSILWVWPVHFEAHPKTAGSEVDYRRGSQRHHHVARRPQVQIHQARQAP